MKFRLHTPQDYASIAELRWILKGNDDNSGTASVKDAFVERYMEHLRACDQEGATYHWIAEADDDVIGIMTVRRVLKEPSPISSTTCWGYLTNSIVDPVHRNLGVGSDLLSSIKRWATDECFELIVVWPSERSYPFYRRAGFEGQEDPLVLSLQSDDS